MVEAALGCSGCGAMRIEIEIIGATLSTSEVADFVERIRQETGGIFAGYRVCPESSGSFVGRLAGNPVQVVEASPDDRLSL
jgi:hypothetical protein